MFSSEYFAYTIQLWSEKTQITDWCPIFLKHKIKIYFLKICFSLDCTQETGPFLILSPLFRNENGTAARFTDLVFPSCFPFQSFPGKPGARRLTNVAWFQHLTVWPDMQVANNVANVLFGSAWFNVVLLKKVRPIRHFLTLWKAWRDKRAGNQGEQVKLTNCSTFFYC